MNPYNVGMDDCLTIGEAADLFPFSAVWIRKLCQEEILDCRKSGDVWLVSRKSLEEYAATDRKPGPEPRTPPE